MTWNLSQSEHRIQKLLASVPNEKIIIENYEKDYFPRFEHIRSLMETSRANKTKPLVDLQPNQAVLIDAVHVYVNLINYDEYQSDKVVDSISSHNRALKFLHLQYSVFDRIVESLGAQRVDFHGARMHAIISQPTGDSNIQDRVTLAFELSQKVQLLSSLAAKEFSGDNLAAKIRIGIDTGMCVAIDSGRMDEKEPLFLGNPANHAAKLADGDQEGIFISDTIRSVFLLKPEGSFLNESYANLDSTVQSFFLGKKDDFSNTTDSILNEWKSEAVGNTDLFSKDTHFTFHSHTPPLKTIDYTKLHPTNSIAMNLLSIFADLSGFTKYVERKIAENNVSELVRNLHVIRGELNHVLQDDFSGRKIRFIGDCLHGVIVKGTKHEVDIQDSIKEATLCVSALRSSFLLCQNVLHGASDIGLSIGFEFGSTPISRIGIRGDRSVRVSSSKCVTDAEILENECSDNSTKIGVKALEKASLAVKNLFQNQEIENLTYGDAYSLLEVENTALTSPAVHTQSINRAHSVYKK